MSPSRIEKYKGREIRIFVTTPVGMKAFKATFEIQVIGDHISKPVMGVVAGGFATPHEAEERALRAAKDAIDR